MKNKGLFHLFVLCMVCIYLCFLSISCQKKNYPPGRVVNVVVQPIMAARISGYAEAIKDCMDVEGMGEWEYLTDEYGLLVRKWKKGSSYSNVYVSFQMTLDYEEARRLFTREREAKLDVLNTDIINGINNRYCGSWLLQEKASDERGFSRPAYYHSFVLLQKGRMVIRIWEQSSDLKSLRMNGVIQEVASAIKRRT